MYELSKIKIKAYSLENRVKPAKFDTKDLIFAIFRGQYQIKPDSYEKIFLPHEIIGRNLLSIELPSAPHLRLHYYPLHPLTPYTLYHIISFSLGTVQSAVGCLLT